MSSVGPAKTIIEHILNGTLETTLCRICLKPFGEVCENIFTQFWFENKICSVVDILQNICQAKFSEKDNYNVCSDCIVEAFGAYNFYLKYQSTTKLLEDYVNEIEMCTASVDRIEVCSNQQICLKLSPHPVTEKFNLQEFDIQSFMGKTFEMCPEEFDLGCKKELFNSSTDYDYKYDFDEEVKDININKKRVKQRPHKRKNKMNFPKRHSARWLSKIRKYGFRRRNEPGQKNRCDLCRDEVKTWNQLLRHQRLIHNQNYCEICSDFYKSTDLEFHLATHEEAYCCDICQAIMSDRNDMIDHIQAHQIEYVCHKCGFKASNPIALRSHMISQHSERGGACKYCGKLYKGPNQLTRHIAKHEVFKTDTHLPLKKMMEAIEERSTYKYYKYNCRQICSECGADFVNERALKQHVMRVHTGERPFSCDECGRGFVTKHLMDQHRVRSHQLPGLRCPLCPNAFHSRAYVNVHIKKVHLNKTKRFTRGFNQEVTWPTTAVRFEELGVKIQHGILEMVRTGDLNLPEEMITDNILKLLNET